MWILSKAGEALYNMDKVVNFYVVECTRDSAVRARFSDGKKDLTIGNYNTCTEAETAIRYVYDCIRQNYPAIQLPPEEKIEMLRRPLEMKDRSATGKRLCAEEAAEWTGKKKS